MIVITQYPQIPNGTRVHDELYEMVGENLDELPADIIATDSLQHLNAERQYNFWTLHHVSEDGTKAWFIQQVTYTYPQDLELNILATGLNPPREQFTDYQYNP